VIVEVAGNLRIAATMEAGGVKKQERGSVAAQVMQGDLHTIGRPDHFRHYE
jgi:hypothetical protein